MKNLALIVYAVLLLVLGCNKKSDFESVISKYDIRVKLSASFDSIEIRTGILINADLKPDDTLKLFLGKDFTNVLVKDLHVTKGVGSSISFSFHNDCIQIPASSLDMQLDTFRLYISYLLDTANGYSKDQFAGFAFMRNNISTHINAAITRTDNWFPKLAGQMNQKLPPFEMQFDIPESHEMMASGQLLEVKQKANHKIFYWKNYDSVIDRSLYFFISPYNRIVKEYADGFQLHMLLPKDTLPGNVNYLADVIHKSYKFFESQFGSIGINEYKVSPFINGYSGLCNSMTLPEKLFTQPIKNNFLQYPIRNVIHECSHSWWGNAVTGSAEKDYWLFEGFAKYSEIVALKTVTGEDVEDISFARMNQVAKAYADYAPSIKDAGKAEERQYQAVSAYYQGALLLKLLENYLGKTLFRKVIKGYLSDHFNQWVNSASFIESVQKYANSKAASLIKTHISNQGFATYEIHKTRVIPMGAENVYHFTLTNKGEKDLYATINTHHVKPDTNFKMFVPTELSYSLSVPSESSGDSVTLDLNEQRNYLITRAGFVGAGGCVNAFSDGKIRFVDIINGTPLANAGIENNTILVAVNGQSTENKDFFQLNEMLLRPKNSNCSYTILVDNNAKEVLVSY